VVSNLRRGGHASDERPGPLFRARYPGECGSCFEPFEEGDEVRYDADDVLVGYECGCGDPYYADC
jgi:hypothetical protein